MQLNGIRASLWRRGMFAAILLLTLGIAFHIAPYTDAQEISPLDPAVWPDVVQLASTASSTDDSRDFTAAPQLSIAPNGTMIVAFNYVSGAYQLPFYARSTDGGSTWSAAAPIHSAGQSLRYVRVAHDGNSVAHAVWRTGGAVFHASEPQWASNMATEIPSPASGQQILDPPAIAVGPDNRLHTVWAQGNAQGGTQPNIFHAYSSNGGASWTNSPALATTAQRSSAPAVAIGSSGIVHVIWEERIFDMSIPGYRFEIYYKKGTPSGAGYSWDATAQILSGNLTSAKRPSLLARGTSVHVAFTRQEGVSSSDQSQYAYYRSFTPSGGWSPLRDVTQGVPLRVNTSNPYFLITSLAYCQGNIYLYFHGATSSNAREQIWGATSKNSWSYLDTVTTSEQRHVYPSLGCHRDNLHMTFERVVQAGDDHRVLYSAQRNNVHLPFITRP